MGRCQTGLGTARPGPGPWGWERGAKSRRRGKAAAGVEQSGGPGRGRGAAGSCAVAARWGQGGPKVLGCPVQASWVQGEPWWPGRTLSCPGSSRETGLTAFEGHHGVAGSLQRFPVEFRCGFRAAAAESELMRRDLLAFFEETPQPCASPPRRRTVTLVRPPDFRQKATRPAPHGPTRALY